MIPFKKYIKWLIVFFVIIAFVIVYKKFDPNTGTYFPKCPSKLLTGLECPGCGSQRAVHHLLNFELKDALKMNALMVVAIPYVILGFVFDISTIKEKAPKWRKILFGERAIYIILFIILIYTILRNIL